MSALDERLIAAHEARDNGLLVDLYLQAAQETQETEAVAFFLTHAYVFALEAGLVEAPVLRQRLIDMGCETPL